MSLRGICGSVGVLMVLWAGALFGTVLEVEPPDGSTVTNLYRE